jgi:hypothetical protein
VKLSLCLIKHQAMKTYWRSGGIAARCIDLGTRLSGVCLDKTELNVRHQGGTSEGK